MGRPVCDETELSSKERGRPGGGGGGRGGIEWPLGIVSTDQLTSVWKLLCEGCKLCVGVVASRRVPDCRAVREQRLSVKL